MTRPRRRTWTWSTVLGVGVVAATAIAQGSPSATAAADVVATPASPVAAAPASSPTAAATDSTTTDSGGAIVIPPSGIAQVPVAIPVPVDSDASTALLVSNVCTGDLRESGYFQIIEPVAFLADLPKEGLGIVPDDWKSVGAQGVVKGRAKVTGDTLQLSLRFYEPGIGDAAVLQRDYTGSTKDARSFVHSFDNDLVKLLTGVDGFFGTKIAFVAGGTGKKEIYVMDSDGANPYAVTNYGSLSILPVWSPGGGLIAFTSYLRGNPDLYLVGPGGGHPRRIGHFDGMNTPGSFSPDGQKLAVTLSKGGPIDIYTMDTSGSGLTRLTDSEPPIIDTSPEFSPDGSQIAFVSNREGGPQLFVMSSSGGAATRVTFAGKYNTEPAWCPRSDVHLLAYTARSDSGVDFDIFTVDLDSGTVTRLTEGQGDNTSPTWAPNGRVIAFASSRGGIWSMNVDGSNQHQISAFGESPRWGPALANPEASH
jgi:TolB protein